MREHLLPSLAAKPAWFEGEVVTVHPYTSSVLSSVGHGLVDREARGVENFEIRSREEFHANSMLTRL